MPLEVTKVNKMSDIGKWAMSTHLITRCNSINLHDLQVTAST